MSQKTCLNCGLESEADFCPRCGQSKAVKLSSVWHLISEAFDVFYNLDSKAWRSIIPLLVKPGALTNEYVAGRRVNYLPPFRMYLILSLFFFLVAAIPEFTGFDELSPEERAELAQDLEDSRLAINDLVEDVEENVEQISENLPDPGLALNEFIQDSIGLPDSSQQASEPLADEINIDQSSDPSPTAAPPEGASSPESFQIDLGGDIPVLAGADDCKNVPWSEFLGERLGTRALNSCQTAFSDNGVTLMQSFTDNLPIMMFVCVPLLAVFMKFLYLFKGRKYIEHLTFLFHAHSFIFALAILTIAIVRLSVPFPTLGNFMPALITAIWLYAFIYVFLALRRVYKQGLFMTSIKMLMLFPSYSICLAVAFVSGLFLTFITI